MRKNENVIDAIISRYKSGKREDLIPLLQEIQEETGYLSEEALKKVGRLMGLSTTKIYGLATFYDHFRFTPLGKYHFVVCNGTGCYLNGSGAVIARIREELGIEPGETTRDGRFSYELSNCMGGCIHGPLLIVNGKYHLKVKPEQIQSMINMFRKESENLKTA